MPADRLRQIEERCGKATNEPWHVEYGDKPKSDWDEKNNPIEIPEVDGIYAGKERLVETDSGYYPPEQDNAEFIAHAREDIPYLLSLVKAADALAEAVDDCLHDRADSVDLMDALVAYRKVREA